jgi:hypothetical protein
MYSWGETFPLLKTKMVRHGRFDKMENRDLSPAAVRALAEAKQRHEAASKVIKPTEVNGRKGPEPTRFGDWESKGIASDF